MLAGMGEGSGGSPRIPRLSVRGKTSRRAYRVESWCLLLLSITLGAFTQRRIGKRRVPPACGLASNALLMINTGSHPLGPKAPCTSAGRSRCHQLFADSANWQTLGHRKTPHGYISEAYGFAYPPRRALLSNLEKISKWLDWQS